MPTIRQLPPEIVAKIAAGEVIERPAYAVKELIENAIDAKADDIQIIIEHSGLKKIQVIDNGQGMSKEDLEICWYPHTTSKITENESLLGIKSFGFRGEALASLSAVSTFTIRSRQTNNSTGNEIHIKDGKILSLKPVGMPAGTVVIAENLFVNIPARRKFLKSPQTEMRHIIDIVSQFTIAYPSIHFSLIHNKRTLIDTPKAADNMTRIQSFVGSDTFQFFIPVKKNDTYVRVSGFIAKPQVNSSTTSKQMIFVNKRKITDKLLSLAVKEAYGTMLEPTAYPLFILFFDLPHEMIDINVHPRKEQVSFINAQYIFQLIKDTVTEVLQENNITFQNLSWKRKGVGTTSSFAGNLLKELVLENENLQINRQTPMVQLHNLYIVTQTKNSVFFVDQHAAHERILFEKLKKEFIKQRQIKESVKLTTLIPLKLSKSEMLILREQKDFFENLGFQFKQNTISHVPQLFQDRNPQEFIAELITELEQGKPISDVDHTSEEMLAFLACRSAVKAGDSLERVSMEKILHDLEQTPNNVTCPHGRPTKVSIDLHEIHTMFKRN